MINTTLCYIRQGGQCLMLHRVKKENDLNQGKWIGIGGKFEDGESPEDCMFREVNEETGLTPAEYRYRGLVTFVSDRWPTEYMHLFTIDRFTGTLRADCPEGDLEWLPWTQLCTIPHWEGDEIFLRLIEEDVPFFSLKLRYRGDILEEAVLNGRHVKGGPHLGPLRSPTTSSPSPSRTPVPSSAPSGALGALSTCGRPTPPSGAGMPRCYSP